MPALTKEWSMPAEASVGDDAFIGLVGGFLFFGPFSNFHVLKVKSATLLSTRRKSVLGRVTNDDYDEKSWGEG